MCVSNFEEIRDAWNAPGCWNANGARGPVGYQPTKLSIAIILLGFSANSKNYQKPKNWLLPLTGESLLVFYFLKKSDMSYKPGCQSTFPPSIFTRSLAFEFLRAG